MEEAGPAPLDEKTIMAYARDLKSILRKGTIIEQKSFLRSFIRRIEAHEDKTVIDYTIPIDTGGSAFGAKWVPKQNDLRNFLMSAECADMAEIVANLA